MNTFSSIMDSGDLPSSCEVNAFQMKKPPHIFTNDNNPLQPQCVQPIPQHPHHRHHQPNGCLPIVITSPRPAMRPPQALPHLPLFPSTSTSSSSNSLIDDCYSSSPSYQKYTLDDFEIKDTLGTGTFGRVHLTQCRHDGKYYAMKVLQKGHIVRLRQVEHVNCEREILSTIQCPFLVKMLCTFQDEQNLYMLLEYVVGGELFSHLRKAGRFSPNVTRFYASQIVVALDYLHQQNVAYRDLKPENILLSDTGDIKITDFGFAKRVLDRTWTLCGTPEYIAPEIIQSQGHGKAVDWWSFGILIFEMMAGYPPFYDDNPFGIYEKILTGQLRFPSHFDPVAKDLVKQLLNGDRTQRLGNLQNGSEDIKNHPWFEGIDWDLVQQRKYKAPFVPQISHPGDTAHFDKYPSPEPLDAPHHGDPYRHYFSQF